MKRTTLVVAGAALLASACSKAAVPGPADVPDIMAEAAGTKPEPKFGDSDVRRAVRMSFRTMLRFDSIHVAEVGARFSRPQLYSYLLLSESFVGGDFPRQTAALLREVQQADLEYLSGVESFAEVLSRRLTTTDISADERRVLESETSKMFAAQQQPVIDAVEKFDKLVGLIADVYELAGKHPLSFKATRTGLEIEDQRVLDRYNHLVDQLNAAHAVADSAIRRLPSEQQARFTRMRVTKAIRA